MSNLGTVAAVIAGMVLVPFVSIFLYARIWKLFLKD